MTTKGFTFYFKHSNVITWKPYDKIEGHEAVGNYDA